MRRMDFVFKTYTFENSPHQQLESPQLFMQVLFYHLNLSIHVFDRMDHMVCNAVADTTLIVNVCPQITRFLNSPW